MTPKTAALLAEIIRELRALRAELAEAYPLPKKKAKAAKR